MALALRAPFPLHTFD